MTLQQAIDICKSSEDAGRQLKAMSTPEEVQPLRRRLPLGSIDYNACTSAERT